MSKHQVDGYVVVTFSSKAYTMKPVRSSTGALRLEEVAGGPMLMVQIPAKSMLMDTARGRRIVDACIHEEQAKEASAPNSLGMNLHGQVDTATPRQRRSAESRPEGLPARTLVADEHPAASQAAPPADQGAAPQRGAICCA